MRCACCGKELTRFMFSFTEAAKRKHGRCRECVAAPAPLPPPPPELTKPGDLISLERLRYILDYNSKSGKFIAKIGRQGRTKGAIAGGRAKGEPYWKIRLDGRQYYAHRLAWFWNTGSWPKEQIDHIDNDPTNNRFENLREATHAENRWNSRRRPTSSSPYKGVAKSGTKWVSSIKRNGAYTYLGTFDTADEAHSAYCQAGRDLHGEFFNAG